MSTRLQCPVCQYVGSPMDFKTRYDKSGKSVGRDCPSCGRIVPFQKLHLLNTFPKPSGGYFYKK